MVGLDLGRVMDSSYDGIGIAGCSSQLPYQHPRARPNEGLHRWTPKFPEVSGPGGLLHRRRQPEAPLSWLRLARQSSTFQFNSSHVNQPHARLAANSRSRSRECRCPCSLFLVERGPPFRGACYLDLRSSSVLEALVASCGRGRHKSHCTWAGWQASRGLKAWLKCHLLSFSSNWWSLAGNAFPMAGNIYHPFIRGITWAITHLFGYNERTHWYLLDRQLFACFSPPSPPFFLLLLFFRTLTGEHARGSSHSAIFGGNCKCVCCGCLCVSLFGAGRPRLHQDLA